MENKPTHGGAREGSGAPKKEVLRKAFCIKLPPELIEAIPKPRTKFIEAAVIAEFECSPPAPLPVLCPGETETT